VTHFDVSDCVSKGVVVVEALALWGVLKIPYHMFLGSEAAVVFHQGVWIWACDWDEIFWIMLLQIYVWLEEQ